LIANNQRAGNITMWNDPAIKRSNQALASLLPAATILIGYNDNSAATIIEVVKRSLESYSPDFAAALVAANRSMANLPPALRGTMVPAGSSTSARITWLKVPPLDDGNRARVDRLRLCVH
jgi:hypothetical protein